MVRDKGITRHVRRGLDQMRESARRTTASAPHNASVIGDPAENWTGGGRQVPQYNWGLMDKEKRIPEWHSGQ